MESNDYGWHPIEPHELLLEGFDGSVRILVDSLLATSSTLATPDALGMTTAITIDRPNSSPSIHMATHHAYYGSLSSLLETILSFTSGRSTDVAMDAVGLRLRLYEHRFGARTGICVSGDVSDVLELEDFPWPAVDIGNRLLLQREAAFHLRFAFKTSVVDPPFVVTFAKSIHQLIRHVESLGTA